MAEYTLTNKDRNLLFELSLNARASITELARKTRMSKQVVSYRLNLLEKNKVILGYHAITNIYKLGKTHYRVFIKYQNMSSEKEEELIDYLVNHPKIVWIAIFDGDLDFAYLVWADNIREFEQIYDEINEKFGKYFLEKFFSIATKIEYLKYKFLNNNKDATSLIFGDCFEKNQLDKLDGNILAELNKDARISLVKIANKNNTSAKVIKTRIDRMLKEKIILGFNIKLDHKKIGYTHRKVFLKLNDVSKEKINKLSSYLKEQPNTIYLVKAIGDYDLEFELMTKTNEEFHKIIKELRTRFSEDINNYSTVIHYFEPKTGQIYTF